MKSLLIEEILRTKRITDYLNSKGIYPVGGEINGKFRYCCPIHKEKVPSFMVYLNGEFENYFCFGCKHKYHIIHLYSALENVSYKEAVKALGKDLNITSEQEIDYAIRDMERDSSMKEEFNPAELPLIIGRTVYDFLKEVEYDPEMVKCTDELFKVLDQAIDEVNMNVMKNIYDNITDALKIKIQEYREKKEKRILEESVAK